MEFPPNFPGNPNFNPHNIFLPHPQNYPQNPNFYQPQAQNPHQFYHQNPQFHHQQYHQQYPHYHPQQQQLPPTPAYPPPVQVRPQVQYNPYQPQVTGFNRPHENPRLPPPPPRASDRRPFPQKDSWQNQPRATPPYRPPPPAQSFNLDPKSRSNVGGARGNERVHTPKSDKSVKGYEFGTGNSNLGGGSDRDRMPSSDKSVKGYEFGTGYSNLGGGSERDRMPNSDKSVKGFEFGTGISNLGGGSDRDRDRKPISDKSVKGYEFGTGNSNLGGGGDRDRLPNSDKSVKGYEFGTGNSNLGGDRDRDRILNSDKSVKGYEFGTGNSNIGGGSDRDRMLNSDKSLKGYEFGTGNSNLGGGSDRDRMLNSDRSVKGFEFGTGSNSKSDDEGRGDRNRKPNSERSVKGYEFGTGSSYKSDKNGSGKDAGFERNYDPLEVENNEFEDDDRVQPRGVSKVRRFRESREFEFDESPKKKSVLFRIGRRNDVDRERVGKFKGKKKDAGVDSEKERVGSPVELDVSFKSNSLVAKPIIGLSSGKKKSKKPNFSFSPIVKFVEVLAKPGSDGPSSPEKVTVSGGTSDSVENSSVLKGSPKRKVSKQVDKGGDLDRVPPRKVRKRRKFEPPTAEVLALQTKKNGEPFSADKGSMHTKDKLTSAGKVMVHDGALLRSRSEPIVKKVVESEDDDDEIFPTRSREPETKIPDTIAKSSTHLLREIEIIGNGETEERSVHGMQDLNELPPESIISDIYRVDDVCQQPDQCWSPILPSNDTVTASSVGVISVEDKGNVDRPRLEETRREENIIVAFPKQSSLDAGISKSEVETSILEDSCNLFHSDGSHGAIRLPNSEENVHAGATNVGFSNREPEITTSSSHISPTIFQANDIANDLNASSKQSSGLVEESIVSPEILLKDKPNSSYNKESYPPKERRKRRFREAKLVLPSPDTSNSFADAVGSVHDVDTTLSYPSKGLVSTEERVSNLNISNEGLSEVEVLTRGGVNDVSNETSPISMKKRKVVAIDEKKAEDILNESVDISESIMTSGAVKASDISITPQTISHSSQGSKVTVQKLDTTGESNLTRNQSLSPISKMERLFIAIDEKAAEDILNESVDNTISSMTSGPAKVKIVESLDPTGELNFSRNQSLYPKSKMESRVIASNEKNDEDILNEPVDNSISSMTSGPGKASNISITTHTASYSSQSAKKTVQSLDATAELNLSRNQSLYPKSKMKSRVVANDEKKAEDILNEAFDNSISSMTSEPAPTVVYRSQGAKVTVKKFDTKGELNLTRNQLISPVRSVIAGNSSLDLPRKKTPVSQSAKPRTWHRTGDSSASPLPPRISPKKFGKFQTTYVRKGNSLVRKPSPVANIPRPSLSPSINQTNKSSGSGSKVDVIDPVKTDGLNKASFETPKIPPLPFNSGDFASLPLATPPPNDCSETATLDPLELTDSAITLKFSEDPPKYYGTPESQRVLDETNSGNKVTYLKRKSNQLVAATSNSSDQSAQGVDTTQTLSSDGYFKRKKNQLIRTSSVEGPRGLTSLSGIGKGSSVSESLDFIPLPDDTPGEQSSPKVISSKRFNKKHFGKGLAKLFKPKSASVWRLGNAQSSRKLDNSLQRQKVWPKLFPWKRATNWRTYRQNSLAPVSNNSSLSQISRKLLLSRKRDTIYTRSTHGLSLRRSKLLSVDGSSLKWSKSSAQDSIRANEQATLAVAAVQKKKRERKGVAMTSVVAGGTKRERIFRIGTVRYKMDPSRKTLQRIPDKETSSSASPQLGKSTKKAYVPTRLLIGNDEYVRIGNGNQLVRDPKKRTRILASEKVRWSLHTARMRLVRKKTYCQFFTRFGMCNKDAGKCPYIHDPDKIAVCTKFLSGSCSKANCKLTHKVIPERMQDCSYYLQGLCSNEDCPYRHVNVNPNAPSCEGFLKGYCADGDECTKKHTYICTVFEATGTCPQGSKCKLHHPKKKTKGTKRKRAEKNGRGRYFVSKNKKKIPELKTPDNRYSKGDDQGELGDYIPLESSDDYISVGFSDDYIPLDVSSDEDVEEETADQRSLFGDSYNSDDMDELIKPIKLMRKILMKERAIPLIGL